VSAAWCVRSTRRCTGWNMARVQQEFVADAAHELRTPLPSWRGSRGAGDRQAATELLADIAGMTRIVNQLIETAEFDA